MPVASGQGCPALQVSSISRAAMPESLILGPSAHQIGPSPSQTAAGVHVKVSPVWTTGVALAAPSETAQPMMVAETAANTTGRTDPPIIDGETIDAVQKLLKARNTKVGQQ